MLGLRLSMVGSVSASPRAYLSAVRAPPPHESRAARRGAQAHARGLGATVCATGWGWWGWRSNMRLHPSAIRCCCWRPCAKNCAQKASTRLVARGSFAFAVALTNVWAVPASCPAPHSPQCFVKWSLQQPNGQSGRSEVRIDLGSRRDWGFC